MSNVVSLFVNCIKAEVIKMKQSKIFWLSLLGPLIIITIQNFQRFVYSELFVPKAGVNPWAAYFSGNWQAISFMLLPFYAVLISNLVVYIEHKSGTWKDIFILPIDSGYIYFSKLTVVHLLLALTLIYFCILQLLSGFLLGILRTEFLFLNFWPDFRLLWTFALKIFISSLSLVSIQFWLSLRNKNYIVPVSLGVLGIVLGIMLFQWKFSNFVPYTYTMITTYQYFHIINFSNTGTGFLYRHELTGLFYSILFLFLGYKEFQKLKIE